LAVRPIGAQASVVRADGLFGAALGAIWVWAQAGGAISNITSRNFFIGLTRNKCIPEGVGWTQSITAQDKTAAEYLAEIISDQEICSPLRDVSARNNPQTPSLSQ
jgi:hypothetical protein